MSLLFLAMLAIFHHLSKCDLIVNKYTFLIIWLLWSNINFHYFFFIFKHYTSYSFLFILVSFFLSIFHLILITLHLISLKFFLHSVFISIQYSYLFSTQIFDLIINNGTVCLPIHLTIAIPNKQTKFDLMSSSQIVCRR